MDIYVLTSDIADRTTVAGAFSTLAAAQAAGDAVAAGWDEVEGWWDNEDGTWGRACYTKYPTKYTSTGWCTTSTCQAIAVHRLDSETGVETARKEMWHLGVEV